MQPIADFALDEEDRFAAPAGPRAPLRRAPPRRRRGLPWIRMGLLSTVTVACLVVFAESSPPPGPEDTPGALPRPALVTPPPVWEPVARPVPLYAVEGLDRAQAVLEVRRHGTGGREDSLSFGHPGEAGSARLRLTRNVPESEGQSFYVDLVRHGAEAGLSVVRSGQAAPLPTKFGLAEAAPVTFAGTTEQACLALRFQHPDVQFSLKGWLCGSPVSEGQLACLVDRLVVTSNEDPALRVLFAQAEGQRNPACSPAPAPKVAAPQPKSANRR